MMAHVTSKDGTRIAYRQYGEAGPAVIFIGGGLDDGAESAPLADELGATYRIFNYARRGRGESGDTQPYDIVREVEDVAALINVAGGRAHLYGVSSGGALALEAAMAGVRVDSLAVYEVPYDTDPDTPRQQAEYVSALNSRLALGDRDGALALFMKYAGSSEHDIENARRSSYWPGLLELAHTLAYDAACLGTRSPPLDRLALLRVPVLLGTGGTVSYFERAADAMSAAIPDAERLILTGQSHVIDPHAFAPKLRDFWSKV